MAIPAYMNITPTTSLFGVTATSEIITAMRALMVTAGNWTEPVANTFKSPVTAGGRYVKVAMSAVDTDTLEMAATDEQDNAISTKRMDIEASGTTRVLLNQCDKFVHIESRRAAGGSAIEFLRAGLLEISPVAEPSTQTVYSHGSRSSGGTLTSNNTDVFAVGGDTTVSKRLGSGTGPTANQQGLVSMDGAWIFRPAYFYNNANTVCLGRMYGHYVCSTLIGFYSVFDIPIDSVTTAQFVAIGPGWSTAYCQLVMMTDGSL